MTGVKLNGKVYTEAEFFKLFARKVGEDAQELGIRPSSILNPAERGMPFHHIAGTTHLVCPKCGGTMSVHKRVYTCSSCGYVPEDDIQEALEEEKVF